MAKKGIWNTKFNINNCNSLKRLTAIAYTLCQVQFFMKLQEVKERITKIENCKADDEMAHVYEDDLFYDFVEAVKDGKYKTRKQIIEVATELFKVRDIDFERWHA